MLKNQLLKKIFLWLVLALPAIAGCIGFITGSSEYDMLMHMTGEFAARFLIISLIATPIAMLFPQSKLPKWLLRNRIYFGVAAFAYTLLHMLFYLYEIAFEEVISEFFTVGMITGWVAFFIFIPMAITSNDYSVRKLKGTWKKIHRWVYAAAIMTFLHWALIHYHWKPALVHFAPVIALQIYRGWKIKSKR